MSWGWEGAKPAREGGGGCEAKGGGTFGELPTWWVGGEREQGNRAGPILPPTWWILSLSPTWWVGGGTSLWEQSRSAKGGGEQGGNYHQPYHQHDGWGGNGNRGTEQVSNKGGGTTSNMMDPIPITNMMGGGGTGIPSLSPTWWVGREREQGNREGQGGTYHQHDGSHPYHQNDGWGGGNGNRVFFAGQQHGAWGGGGTLGALPPTLSPTWWVGGGTGTGEQSRSYPTTNMMDPIPITNMMGGGGEREQGNRAGQQHGGGNRGGTFATPSRTWWVRGEREQGQRAGPILPPTWWILSLSPTWWVGGGTSLWEQSRSAKGGGEQGGNYHQPYHQHDGWGGNGNRGTEQVSNKGGGNRGGRNYQQHDGSGEQSRSATWGGGGNRGGTIINPITNMMGGGEREQGNRAGPILPPTWWILSLSPTWWVGGGTSLWEQSRSAKGGGNREGTTTNPITNRCLLYIKWPLSFQVARSDSYRQRKRWPKHSGYLHKDLFVECRNISLLCEKKASSQSVQQRWYSAPMVHNWVPVPHKFKKAEQRLGATSRLNDIFLFKLPGVTPIAKDHRVAGELQDMTLSATSAPTP